MRLVSLVLWVGVSACGAGTNSAPEPRVEQAEPAATYEARGTVEEVREERRQVVIHHEPVPGYMPEMTMPFAVDDLTLLDGLAAGQRVRFTFVAERGGRHVLRSVVRL